MFTDKPIIYGAWGELFDDIKEDLLPLHKTDGLIYAKSKDEFKNIISDLINIGNFKLTEHQLLERKKMREMYFHNPDGKVCERILNDVKKIVLDKKIIYKY